MTPAQLLSALDELDAVLTTNGIRLEIFICGAMAIQLQGFKRVEPTYDADTIKPIEDERILEFIAEIGDSNGLQSNWLNDQAASVDIPEGALERSKPLGRWKSIHAVIMDRVDLIKMKAGRI